jgi:hypothetical protein
MALVAQSGFVLFTAHAELAFRRSTAACEGYLQWHPHLMQEAAECSYRPGWLADERSDSAEAMRWMKVAAGSTSDDGAIARAYLLLGSRDGQVAADMDALAGERRGAEIWWKRTWAADAGLLAALAWRRLGQPKKALAALEAALPVIEETEQIQSNPFHQRRLNRVRAELARELATSAVPAERARARQLATHAVEWYRQAGGYEAMIQRLVAIAEPEGP